MHCHRVRPIHITLVLCALLAAGCTTYSKLIERKPVLPRSNRLAQLDLALRKALHVERRDPVKALPTYIATAQTAWARFEANPADVDARASYNFAVGRIVTALQESTLEPWDRPVTVPAPDGSFTLTHRLDKRSAWRPSLYQITPADQFEVKGKYVSTRTLREGVGAPVVSVARSIRADARESFVPRRNYYGVTAIARFRGRTCELAFEDPLASETTRIADKNYPMAADFTVPLAALLEDDDNNPRKQGLSRYFRPGKYDDTARIVRLEPYDPNKTVVLVIHGLTDSQATWTPMINALRGEEDIRRNFQFWFFSYPTGYPYPHSAAILRNELEGIRRKFHPAKPMVVIGHSMGGCISRLLITDSGDRLWRAIFRRSPDDTSISPESREFLDAALIFDHRPEVGRVIFMAAPLKGSKLASNCIGRLGSSLIKSPITLLRVSFDAARFITLQSDELKLRRAPSSVDTLAPDNRFVRAINTIPVTPGIPHHVIAGDRGRGNAPHSSDGIVPYWSSHMDTALSEKIVPSGHAVHQHPEGILEVHRILKVHAGLD